MHQERVKAKMEYLEQKMREKEWQLLLEFSV